MSRRATLKASDADREQIAERLRKATAEGRLLAEELEERLEATFGARTYGELDAVVADLPGATVRRAEHSRSRGITLTPVHVIALFLLAPVIISLLLAVAVILATLFSAWGLLLIVGWFVFGHGRRQYWGSYRRSVHAASRWPARRAPGPRPWI
jgi:Domain of unknown function (DUF1707)